MQSHGMLGHLLRKDAQIGGLREQIAKRATSADNSTELLWGVAPVALTDLHRFNQALFPHNLAGWRRPRLLRL